MQIDYFVELDYGDEDDLKIGDLVEIPASFPEFPEPGRVCRVVDHDPAVPISTTETSEAFWILDPLVDAGPTADPAEVGEDHLVWPVERGGELIRVRDEYAIPGTSDIERWVVEGMRRDGLTPAAYVNATRQ
jgi:hypothetical protein